MGMAELTCQEIVELITEYLEGTLSSPDRESFERHLAVCDGCTAYLEQFRETIRLTGQLEEDDLTPHEREEFLAAFAEWRRER